MHVFLKLFDWKSQAPHQHSLTVSVGVTRPTTGKSARDGAALTLPADAVGRPRRFCWHVTLKLPELKKKPPMPSK